MNEERQVAKEMGYESPVHDSIEETHACYNKCATHIIENL
jgi:proline dehydrogenase